MCGIIGVFGRADAVDVVKQGLVLMHARGRDGCGVATQTRVVTAKNASMIECDAANGALGHTLHAMVGNVLQPIRGAGTLVANCEIYNWKEVDASARNDTEALLWALDDRGKGALDELDGVYALAYQRGNELLLARDVLGVKPLWFVSTTDVFAFASEKKVLLQLGFAHVQELNPRHMLFVDLVSLQVRRELRSFFSSHPEIADSEEKIKENIEELLSRAIAKRVPDQQFGVLFSGGIDSTLIAVLLKQRGYRVPCYSVCVEGVRSKDDDWSQEVARAFDLDVRPVRVSSEQVSEWLPVVTRLIEDSNVVKVGVALTFFAACVQASKDGCKALFSGLGSEEVFAGYQRHLNAANVNRECVQGLLKMYERDLYRDDVVAMSQSIELRLPFLDRALVEYGLRIPAGLKIQDGMGKMVLRRMAMQAGIHERFALRPKSAAQYGSGMDKAIEKLARSKGLSKSALLRGFYAPANVKLAVLFSGGKDSTYAAMIMKEQNYELSVLISMRSENAESYMFHTPAIDVTAVQAAAMQLPHMVWPTSGVKEQELEDLRAALSAAKDRFGVEGVVSGALFSSYQRDRIERVCDELGLKIFAPLWHKPQAQEMEELLIKGFSFVLSSVGADGLDASWLGRVLTPDDLEELLKLHGRNGLNVAGEGGEFESLVLDCPLFAQPVKIEYDVVVENECTAHMVVKRAWIQE